MVIFSLELENRKRIFFVYKFNYLEIESIILHQNSKRIEAMRERNNNLNDKLKRLERQNVRE